MEAAMVKNVTLCSLVILTLSVATAFAAGGEGYVEDYEFSFEGPFGTYDQNQLQRGFQVYNEVCASCHGLKYVPLRTLADPDGLGLPDEQVRAYASDLEIYDPVIDDYRARKPSDHFPDSALETAPDLSVMAKARAGFHGPYGLGLNQLFKGTGGAEYIASLLTHYTGEEKEEAGAILYENETFSGGYISMAPPLWEDAVEYVDGTFATEEQMAKDVAAFLMWAAEPKMMARKQAGFNGVLLLVLLSVLLYLTNKRLWAPVKRKGVT